MLDPVPSILFSSSLDLHQYFDYAQAPIMPINDMWKINPLNDFVLIYFSA